ncbi:hypothetical protein [Bifidobacterium leontopitheci]|uniref:hypothetical protein n=1 Tax=Bifidobacterium leontopitheci TaxID=2650774 RepID=UPI0012643EB3|nr:hypothetical protein [Bifidobacterium leontopitheci]
MNVKHIKTLATTFLAVVCVSSFAVPSAMATAPPGVSPASVTIAPTRGCTDDRAGCWVGFNALGDLQFALAREYPYGNWPGRGSYSSGNRQGRVTYLLGGQLIYSGIAAPYHVIYINRTVVGKTVDRR